MIININRISGAPLSLYYILLLASVLVLNTVAGADPAPCFENGCEWVQLGSLNFEKTATIQLQNYIFKAVDYDGKGSAAVSFYNISTPGDIHQTVVTEGEYNEEGDLKLYGLQVTNIGNVRNGTDVFGLWPCCPRAKINVWKKITVKKEPVVNPPVVTFTLSDKSFRFGDEIGYTIRLNTKNSNVRNLKIIIDPKGLELVKGETNIYYDKIYGDFSSTYNGILRVPMISMDTYKPHVVWSYIDSNDSRVEKVIEAVLTMQSPIKIYKNYPDMVCTGQDAVFTISLENTQSVPVKVQIKDALPFGFILHGNASILETKYELNPGQIESFSYTAASKTIGTAQVPAAKAVWKLGSLEGAVEVGNSRTIEVNGPLIQIEKNVTLIDDAADTDFKKFNITINIRNRGDTSAYIEIKDTIPAGAKILKGNTTYRGAIEINGTRRISYEMLFSNTSITNLTHIDPDVRIFVRKGDDDNTYSNSYIIIRQRNSSGQAAQPQPKTIESNANRNPSVVWPDYTDMNNYTGLKEASDLKPSGPLIIEINNQSIISKILNFLKSKL